MGAYATAMGPGPVTGVISRNIISVYRTPALHMEQRLFSLTRCLQVPIVGREGLESKYILEQLIDKAARELGIDRIELRRRNLILRMVSLGKHQMGKNMTLVNLKL